MLQAKSTTSKAKEHEEFVEKMYEWDHAKRSRSSGASFHDPVDVTSDSLVIECEYTENDSYRLKRSFWEEVVKKQYNGKQPTLAIRFREKFSEGHDDLIVMSLHDHTAIMEELEAYRAEALQREI